MIAHDNRTRTFGQPPHREKDFQWWIPVGIASVLMLAATLFFNATGLGRSRTADYNNLNSAPGTSTAASRPY